MYYSNIFFSAKMASTPTWTTRHLWPLIKLKLRTFNVYSPKHGPLLTKYSQFSGGAKSRVSMWFSYTQNELFLLWEGFILRLVDIMKLINLCFY